MTVPGAGVLDEIAAGYGLGSTHSSSFLCLSQESSRRASARRAGVLSAQRLGLAGFLWQAQEWGRI